MRDNGIKALKTMCDFFLKKLSFYAVFDAVLNQYFCSKCKKIRALFCSKILPEKQQYSYDKIVGII